MDISKLQYTGKWFSFYFDSEYDLGELKLKLKLLDPFSLYQKEALDDVIKAIADCIVDWNLTEGEKRIEPTPEKKIEILKHIGMFKLKDENINLLSKIIMLVADVKNFFVIS